MKSITKFGGTVEEETLGLLTLTEAAKLLRLSRSRLYVLASEGVVPSVQVGGQGKILFVRRDLISALQPKARHTSHESVPSPAL